MEVVGAVASVITLVGVAKTSVKAFSFLEEIRETQNDYRLLRREIESIEAAARSAERRCSFTNNPQSIDDMINNQQLLSVAESLQDIVDELTDIQLKCARDRDDDESEAKKHKWIRYKTRLSDLQRRGQSVKMDLMLVYHGHSHSQMTQITQAARRIEAAANLRPDLGRLLEEFATERGHRITITLSERPTETVTLDDDATSPAVPDPDDTLYSSIVPTESPAISTGRQHANAELVARFRSNASLECPQNCQCRCHGSRQVFQSPPWMRSFLGSWSGGYHQSPSAQTSRVTRCGCGRARRGSWWLDYEAPLLFWMKTLQIRTQYGNTTGVRCTMRFPRFAPLRSDTWDIPNVSIDRTKARLNYGWVYLPDDQAEHGVELLEYIILSQNLELLELMMQLWAGFLRNGISRRVKYAIHEELLCRSTSDPRRHILRKLLSQSSDDEELHIVPSQFQKAARSGKGLKEALMQTENEIESDRDSVDPINDLDEAGLAPLHHAAIRGDADSVQQLVDAGADVNVKDRRRETPISIAAAYGYVDSMRVLIRASCNVNEQMDGKWTALHHAASNSHYDAIRLLLKHGARASVKDVGGRTPLHHLVYGAQNETTPRAAEALLSAADVDINDLNADGTSAAMLAIICQNTSPLQSLVSAGASLAPIDTYMRGLLHLGAICAVAETLRYLHGLELSALSASIDAELLDCHGRTAWDDFVFCITAPAWQLGGKVRRPDQHEISAFILLYQGVRDRNLEHSISVLERALDALTIGDTKCAANLVSEIAKLKTQCHNHTAAGFYRGMQKEIQAKGQEAVAILEDEVEALKGELAHSLQDELAMILRQVDSAGGVEDTQP